ncbi:MAG: hypothetical protein JXM73_25055, partial [Anaerolineae bacterium]|nr:hypothetical protein [Anaerolineae bacterium]
MKTRILMVSSLLITLALLFSLGAAAQMPDSPYGPQTRGSQPQALPAHNGQIDESFPHAPAPAGSGVSSASALNVDLGEPGLSFRYVQTFGETETAFLEDNNHFYYVEGLGVDGNNIWVTDSWSDRVLKFDSDGNFLQKIGKAGFRDATPTSLEYVTDVGVDTAGNIWVVDAAAAHVAKFDASGNHVSELGQTWNSGSDNNHFNDPIGIAFDGAGNIYVSDSGVWGDYGNHRVQIFDSSGSYLATLGQTGNPGAADDQFRRPRHIAIYGNLLYVADAGNHRVQVFNISVPGSPAYAATLGTTGSPGSDNSHFDFPEGVGADANYIYVADSNNHRVQVFSRTSYAYVATLGSGYGQGDYQFVRPTDVVADTAGRIYVADKDNKRVQQFDSSRVYQRTYGTTGVSYVTDGYHFYTPLGVAVGSDGSVHIVEERGHRLVKLNADGVPQWAVGEPGQSGGDNSHFFGPQDVAVDSHGRVYVVEGWGNDRVQIFNSDASYHATMGTGWGDGSYQFKGPNGIAVDATDRIYVADSENHRVQIYEPIGAYLATLGQTGTSGSGNGHFNLPTDVAVDSSGTIYVADEGNDRVQVFNSNRQYVRTIGQTGSPGNDFGRFSSWGPHRLAVDAQGRLYVSDSGNNRIQVFDSTGAYLTTISGSWGSRTGQFRGPFGLAVGPDGAVYVADRDNSRIQKFALGMPGWVQTNINGFGERANRIAALAPFGGHLYAGTFNSGNGAQLWRAADGLNWTAVITNGFGNSANMGMDHLVEFSGQLYAGTWADDVNGGEVWRSDDGLAWTQVVNQGFGDPTNGEVFHMTVFSGTLYAGTWSYTSTHGAEIWRSDTGDNGDWENVAANGLGDPSNVAVLTMEEFDGNLYAGIYSWNAGQPAGCEVWRTADGSTWT